MTWVLTIVSIIWLTLAYSPYRLLEPATLTALASRSLILLVLWMLLRRTVHRLSSRVRPTVVLVTYALSSLTASVAAVLLGREVAGDSTAVCGYCIASMTINTTLWASLATILLADLAHGRALMADLRAEQHWRQRLRIDAAEQLRAREAALIADMRALVTQAIVDARGDALSDAAPRSPMDVAQRLLGAVDAVVRPLSRRVANDALVRPSMPRTDSQVLPKLTAWFGRMTRQVGVSGPYPWRAVPLLLALASVSVAVGVFGTSGALFVVMASVLSAVVLGIAECMTRTWRRQARWWVALAVACAVWVATGSFVGVIAWAIPAISSTSPSSPFGIGGIAIGMCIMLASLAAATRIREDDTAHLKLAIESTALDEQRTRRAAHGVSRRLAVLAHGQVQAKMTAAAFSLTYGHTSEGEIEHLLTNLAAECVAVLDADVTSGDDRSGRRDIDLANALQDICGVWSATLPVSIQWHDEPMGLAHALGAQAYGLVEVVREALLNVVKHTDCSHASIEIARTGDTVSVLVASSGGTTTGSNARVGGGLGASILDDLCDDWDLRVSDTGSQLTAHILVP